MSKHRPGHVPKIIYLNKIQIHTLGMESSNPPQCNVGYQ